MAKYRANLPQLSGKPFLSDGGIETSLIYLNGIDLPYFASFDLLRRPGGKEILRAYFSEYAATARAEGVGFILESATWRASPDWAAKLGYSEAGLDRANREAIELLVELRREFETAETPIVISGCVGPRGDGYIPGQTMTAEEAEAYHGRQIRVFAATEADMVTAITMNNVNEAIGIARAAKAAGMPVAIAFTVETDGKLPTGQALADAIAEVDRETGNTPAYFMVNCAHPAHFADVLASGEPWVRRVRGLRANASTCSHAELDKMTELDAGDPADLARRYAALAHALPHINVFGGCCGTDHRHIEAIWHACKDEVRRIGAAA